MASSVATAVKQVLEGAGLGLRVYRDNAPAGSALPYATVYEAVTTRPAGFGTGAVAGAVRSVIEEVQIDLWQEPGRGEVFDLHWAALRALVEASWPLVAGKPVMQVQPGGVVRQAPGPDATVVRTIVTILITRHI